MRHTSRPSHLVASILAVLGLAAAGIVQAQSAPAAGPGSRIEQRAARHAEHRADMHKRLHDTLKLSADQEGAWKKFSDSMQPPARPALARDALAGLTAPERADKMLELSRQRQAEAEKHAAALKEFYAVLNSDQKRAFDAFHAGMRPARGGMPMRGHGGPGHMGMPM